MIICVLGAGTMGSGIAQTTAQHGFHTILFDVQADMPAKAKAGIEKNLQHLVSKQKISAADSTAILSRLQFTADITQCTGDVIIEAIVEDMAAKVTLFNQVAQLNPVQTILATNTSSLSVSAIQKNILHPGRVAGMHFFNPAPLMKLVEVVQGRQTDTAVVETITKLVLQLGKIPVQCKDVPGFIVNRVARPYYLEAMKLVELGYATVEQADAVLEAAGFKMGPFKLMDLIGLDVNYAVSNSVYQQMGQPDRLTPSVLQQQKVAAGKLGRKTGEGFYTYSA